jgi:hypothetical protein
MQAGIVINCEVFSLTIHELAEVEPLGTNNLVGLAAVVAHTVLTVDGYAFCQRITPT